MDFTNNIENSENKQAIRKKNWSFKDVVFGRRGFDVHMASPDFSIFARFIFSIESLSFIFLFPSPDFCRERISFFFPMVFVGRRSAMSILGLLVTLVVSSRVMAVPLDPNSIKSLEEASVLPPAVADGKASPFSVNAQRQREKSAQALAQVERQRQRAEAARAEAIQESSEKESQEKKKSKGEESFDEQPVDGPIAEVLPANPNVDPAPPDPMNPMLRLPTEAQLQAQRERQREFQKKQEEIQRGVNVIQTEEQPGEDLTYVVRQAPQAIRQDAAGRLLDDDGQRLGEEYSLATEAAIRQSASHTNPILNGLRGAGANIQRAAEGMSQAIADPAGAAKMAGEAIYHLPQTVEAVAQHVKHTAQEEGVSFAIGGAVSEVGMYMAPGMVVGGVANLVKSAGSASAVVAAADTAGDVARVADVASDAARVADTAGDAARVADTAGDAARLVDTAGDGARAANSVADTAADATRITDSVGDVSSLSQLNDAVQVGEAARAVDHIENAASAAASSSASARSLPGWVEGSTHAASKAARAKLADLESLFRQSRQAHYGQIRRVYDHAQSTARRKQVMDGANDLGYTYNQYGRPHMPHYPSGAHVAQRGSPYATAGSESSYYGDHVSPYRARPSMMANEYRPPATASPYGWYRPSPYGQPY